MSLTNPKDSAGWGVLQQARAAVKKEYPYFYSLLLGLIPRPARRIGTLFVSESLVLGIDFEWFGTLSIPVAMGCLIHEEMHILRDITRLRQFDDRGLGGKALDIPINDDLRTAGIELPHWAIYSDTYGFPKGLTAEKYYELLLKKGVSGNGGLIGSGNCGGCAGTPFDEVEIEVDDPGQLPPDVHHFRNQAIRELREQMKKGGFGRGNTPGSLRDLLKYEESAPAIIPWRQVARGAVGRSCGNITHGHADYSLRRPSKRSYALGMLRPGLIGHEPVVCFLEDASGSMGSEQLLPNRREVASLMEQLGITEVWFIQADVIVQNQPRMISIADLKRLPVLGRGGTDFRPAIEHAMKLKPTPELLVYSTDGDGEAPDHQPRGTEFIWLLAPGPWTRSPCNWGIQILTTDDPKERKKYHILD